ncbi:MAG TPA: multiheme c-type cytochrome [Myxococcota bacterium]|jgi:peroxiredoxin/nitrate/TMAO reductase-like tetraheme cytochrome c subunit
MLAAVRFRILAPALALAVALACRQEPDASTAQPAAAPEAVATAAAPTDSPAPAPRKPARARDERPLPAISGWTLDDQRFQISSLLGQRLLLFFFNPEVREASVVAKTIQEIAPLRGKNNFQIVGIATGSNRARAAEFAKQHGFDFPIVDDSSAAIAQQLGMRVPVALLGVDSEGYVNFGLGQFATDEPGSEIAIEEQIREALRLPTRAGVAEEGPGNQPLAPTFQAPILDVKESFDLAAQRGKPLLLIFFLHTCPHCHDLLGFLKEYLPTLPADKRPQLVGIEISGRTESVRTQLRTDGFDFFPVLFDHDGKIRAAYGVFAGVPDTFLIDAEGRIFQRQRGWERAQHEALLRMRIAKLAGAPVPMLLRTKGFSGSDVCGVCHELAHETWTYTRHATAFDTLVKHGADADPECVGCHVVGYGEPGGFTSARETPDLENVGCESCHGRGGPHLSPKFVSAGNYQPACGQCHDPKHSLGFEYATFLPRISHAANAAIAKLPPEEKRKQLAARGAPRKDVLPTNPVYVGSDACRSCHASEFETWSASPHAHAVETLTAVHKQGNPDCLRCHTTGFGRPGGFPEKGQPAEHADLAAVGCESCHGPGGDHVAEGAVKIGTIVSLGDKCDSCVILQICGACHDDANDPGFEFEVKKKIELQRHGTLEPGTGKPKGKSARLEAPRRVEDLLAQAFAARDAGR